MPDLGRTILELFPFDIVFALVDPALGNDGSHDSARTSGHALTAGNAEYTGRVDGNKIEGTVKGSSSGSWTATRAGAKTPAMAK